MIPNKLLLCSVTIAFLLSTYHSTGNGNGQGIEKKTTMELIPPGMDYVNCHLVKFQSSFQLDYPYVLYLIKNNSYEMESMTYQFDQTSTKEAIWQQIEDRSLVRNNDLDDDDRLEFKTFPGKQISFERTNDQRLKFRNNKNENEFFMANIVISQASIFFTLCTRDDNDKKILFMKTKANT